jgi:glycosyltransferase involved in cell wall biosynthesis
MRVGVLRSAAAPHAGGGFTFEQEIFDQLILGAGSPDHRFVVLDAPAALRPATLPENVEFRLAPPEPLHRLLRRARRFRIDRLAAEAQVDVVWNLSPFHYVTDTPFITVVWDLQHRLQPFFPEVSAKGEWAARERDHAVRLRRAAAVIAGTEAGRREVSLFYQVPEQRIHVLPHPTPRFALEAAAARPGLLDRFRLPSGYLFYPAQFWPHKNHVNLLLALKLLKDQGLALPLVLSGSDKGNAATVRELAGKLGLAGQVNLLGFVSVDELAALYRGALCLAYVSLFGPENLPPLEAFALQCPVLAAEVPGSLEQLGDAALLVDATQPPRIAEALRRMHDDAALRAALVARGRARARRWTGKEFVRGVCGILDGLAPFVRCWRP